MLSELHWVGPLRRIEWLFWAKKTSKFRPKTLEGVRKLGPCAVYQEDSKTAFLEANGFTDPTKITRSEQSVRMLDSGRVDTKYLYLALTLADPGPLATR